MSEDIVGERRDNMSITVITSLGDSPLGILSKGGEYLSILLIIILSISLLLADTKYFNKMNSRTLSICSRSLILIFILIVIFKIIIVI